MRLIEWRKFLRNSILNKCAILFTTNKPKLIMNDSTLDLFCDHGDDERCADEFAMEIEMKAAVLEITTDYYMMEFM